MIGAVFTLQHLPSGRPQYQLPEKVTLGGFLKHQRYDSTWRTEGDRHVDCDWGFGVILMRRVFAR